ncbi:hypothetical protein [[Eubacterium] cellulosolvens]
MNWKLALPGIIVLILVMTIFSFPISTHDNISITNQEPETASCPTWEISDYWEYSIETEHFPDTEAFMACYDIVDGNYMMGVDDRQQALIHSLFNVNPMLGRISIDNLAVYENGEPKNMYQFPLYNQKTWQVNMFKHELVAKAKYDPVIVTCQGELPGFEITAKADNGFIIIYNYIPELKWFTEFTVINEKGTTLYNLQLIDHGTGFHGTVYFMRGRDLYDRTCESAGINDPTVIRDQIKVSGHPKYGEFDFLAINVAVNVEGNGWTRVTVLNPEKESVYNKDIFADKHDFIFTEIPNMNGDWEISFSLYTDSTAQVIIAGVLEYSATI